MEGIRIPETSATFSSVSFADRTVSSAKFEFVIMGNPLASPINVSDLFTTSASS